jgi:hypothetical protein
MSRLRMPIFLTHGKQHERGDFMSSQKVNQLLRKQLGYRILIDVQLLPDVQSSEPSGQLKCHVH